LLHYHRWSAPTIAPENSVNYYEKALDSAGGTTKLRDSYLLFRVPGMAHCGGGDGPNNFDMLGALEQWKERGKPPGKIIASRVNHGVVERNRPLCPYPQIAVYQGTGSTDDAADLTCKTQ